MVVQVCLETSNIFLEGFEINIDLSDGVDIYRSLSIYLVLLV